MTTELTIKRSTLYHHLVLFKSCNLRRVSFWCNTSCTTRFKNVHAWKTKQKENIRTKFKEIMLHIPMFKAQPNVQRHPTINWVRMNVRHYEVQAPCHNNPTTHACRQNYGSFWFSKMVCQRFHFLREMWCGHCWVFFFVPSLFGFFLVCDWLFFFHLYYLQVWWLSLLVPWFYVVLFRFARCFLGVFLFFRLIAPLVVI